MRKLVFIFFYIINANSQNCTIESTSNAAYNSNKKVLNEYNSNYYQLSGNVKKVLAVETTYYNNSTSSTSTTQLNFNKFNNIEEVLEFTKNEKYRTSQKYFYNTNNQICSYEKHYLTKDFTYTETFDYKDTLLIEKWVKSTYQKDFFIKERYTYDNKCNLVKSENLNNKINTYPLWKEGTKKSELIAYYCYDSEGNKIKIDTYIYTYRANFKGLPDEKEFSHLNSTDIEYVNRKKVKQTTLHNIDSSNGITNTNIKNYNYDKDGFIQFETEEKISKYPDFKKIMYTYVNKKLVHKKILLNNNKTFNSYFNANEILIKSEFVEDNKVSNYSIYNKNGHLVKYKINQDVYQCKIIYDSKGNWINYKKIQDNKIIEEKNREIEYYD